MTNHRILTAIRWVRVHQVLVCVAVTVGIWMGLYTLLFLVPRTIQLSYATAASCTAWPTLLPTLQQQAGGSSELKVSLSGGIEIGGVPLLATKLCAQPGDTLLPGDQLTTIAPMGGLLFRQHIAVEVPQPPVVLSEVSHANPIPTTKPLVFSLAGTDVINTYTLKINDKTTKCVPEKEATISCDLPALDLEQGAEYDTQLLRQYGAAKPVVVAKAHITTLTATAVIDGTVKQGDTIYARPTEFTFTADKPLKRAAVLLTQEGDNTAIEAKTTVKEALITATVAEELPREKGYTLTITDLEAIDGSSLADPYKVSFTMSGGPKVTNVSIGKSGVATNARIVVTFDQELSDKQDITKIASISGGAAAISRAGNQVIYTLQGMATCVPFTLTIAKGMLSKYDVESGASWVYGSRTICHTTSVYGYSVKGRALVAYHFGNSGPLTMYVGAIHGNEPSSSGIMRAWIDDLEANPSLYAGKRVVVVPTINPDGVAAGTRTNSRGVDLNRNFSTANWVSDSENSNGTSTGSGGSEPLSEPEAKALANFTTSMRPRLLLSFHAVGSLVVGDPGGYSAGYAAKYASMVGYRDTTYSTGGGFEYDITGAYEDWTYSRQGIPSMVIELGSYTSFNFPHHRAAMRAMLN